MVNEKRLIDANVLIQKLQEAVTHKGMGAAIAGVLIRYIEKLPTVDAVEVVHGRWVRCKDWDYDYECSVCEGYAGEDIDGNYNKLTPYCPNCGAKMDGKSNVPRTDAEIDFDYEAED